MAKAKFADEQIKGVADPTAIAKGNGNVDVAVFKGQKKGDPKAFEINEFGDVNVKKETFKEKVGKAVDFVDTKIIKPTVKAVNNIKTKIEEEKARRDAKELKETAEAVEKTIEALKEYEQQSE